MFKLCVFVALVAVAVAAPTPGQHIAAPVVAAPVAYTAPVVAAAPFVTARSSQFVSQNFHGVASSLVAAPLVAHSAPLVAAPAPYYAQYAAAPYAAAPYAAAPYAAAPYAAAPAYYF